jgi:hypothetical protein
MVRSGRPQEGSGYARGRTTALFELHDDRRPAGDRTAAERYAAPSLFSLLDEG